jgi:hypothetical protein
MFPRNIIRRDIIRRDIIRRHIEVGKDQVAYVGDMEEMNKLDKK